MTEKDKAYDEIAKLVERFSDQFDSYKKSGYNETMTRRDFIDPFFKALGWDVDNSNGYAEAYREVIHEDKVKVGKATKAPDYSFRLVGGKRLFFVEAKKPNVFVKDEIQPAYQVRRYGWSAKLPVSIITDFEEFAIYDCTKKPQPTDKTSVARIKYLTFKDYLNEFEFLWDTFSKERVLKGSFDKFVQGNQHKKGTATVDKEFLLSLDSWRTVLATSISSSNKELNEDEINFVVQQTIDRIIFLRIAEDRSIEPYGNLQLSIQQGNFYQNLFLQFQQADDKYNSGLFDFKKDKISKSLSLDNKVLKTIINELYYPESPYEFSVLSVEILGSAYEQFLGKVIRIDKAHRAHIEEKPEVRKAGGVYYTPQYIVEYIVKNTVGKLIENKTPNDISKIKIVDPACGSGSFLIGAYQFLLDWHKNYYTDDGKISKGSKSNPLTPEGNLTTSEKKRILLNNIFGVDIDVNAVEVTKLSLLLKCMEGETEASITSQMKLFNERVLPTLDSNIKDGNSLVDIDFYAEEFDFGEEKKVKPFNWQKGFPEVFKKGGFDCVIGNPPYGASFNESELNYFKVKYKTTIYRGESYLLFIEKGINLLLKNGSLGFIIPDTLLNLGFTQTIRDYLLCNSNLKEIVSLPSSVFSGAIVDTILLFAEKKEHVQKFHATSVSIKYFNKKTSINSIENPQRIFKVETKDWYSSKAFNLQTDNIEQNLLTKIEMQKKSVRNIAEMYSGIKVYEVGKGKPPQTEKVRNEKPYTSEKKIDKSYKPFFDGKHIGRYQFYWKDNNWIKYGEWLAAPRNPENFEGEKILIRKITGKTLISTYISETSYCNTLLFVLKLKDKSSSYKSILSILNSNLIGWYFRKKFQISDEDTFPQIMIRDILQFPIPEIRNEKESELNKLTDQLLNLNKEISESKLATQIEQMKSKIDFCESRINEIVYQLYELTEEEIKIVKA
jgi:type I restriction-modification system DNA methylase subunit